MRWSVLVGLMTFLTALALSPILVSAATWRVEKDGSGSFTVIQDAVDAAASGDTVQIGAGRFDEKTYVTSPGWSDSVRVLVTQYELTIIGSGPETVIGQAIPWTSEQGDHKGIVASDYFGNYFIRISDLRFENMRDAIYTSHESIGQNRVSVTGCEFFHNEYSMALIGDGGGVEVSTCSFDFMPNSGVHLIAWNQSSIEVGDCSFRLNKPVSQKSMSLINVANAVIDSCSFSGGSTGISAGFGGPVVVRNCLFDGQSNVAFYPDIMSNMSIEDCTFSNQTRVLTSSVSDNQVEIKNSVIENVSDCSILMSYVGSLTVRNCDLAGGARGAVYVQDIPNCTTPIHLDMANNYWGTSDPDNITLLIRDGTDSDQACYFIDYEPFLPTTTPTEKKSFGDFKTMFR